jgi:dienelactone hydrolase
MPGQLHKKEDDRLMDDAGVEALERAAGDAPLEVFTYSGGGHLFADPQGPDYDADAAQLMLERELEFLDRLGH